MREHRALKRLYVGTGERMVAIWGEMTGDKRGQAREDVERRFVGVDEC